MAYTYVQSRQLFLRLLALVYFIAFLSIWWQADGLIGPDGILPADRYLRHLHNFFGSAAYWKFPSVFWLNPSIEAFHLACCTGAISAALLFFGVAPPLNCLILWFLYLSITVVGQEFLSFQWDLLLIEVGFLSIFLGPFQLRTTSKASSPPEGWIIFLFHLLLFKLMFLSGFVKLASGDSTWRDLTALSYHYLTQPLPHRVAWYLHQLPLWFHRLCTAATLIIELVVPFLIFMPGVVRRIAFIVLSALQILIIASGNYGFFNLLTLALCVLLLDDTLLGASPPASHEFEVRARTWRQVPIALLFSLILLLHIFRSPMRTVLPDWLTFPLRPLSSLRSVNSYGLFAVMTKKRDEVVIEGSLDGEHWHPYHFRWKPQDLEDPPGWTGPHMPRLDWQMWFAALQRCGQSRWFIRFLDRLAENSPPVLALLAENPFPDEPPRFLRTTLYRYRFTTAGNHNWWRREKLGRYCPTLKAPSAFNPGKDSKDDSNS